MGTGSTNRRRRLEPLLFVIAGLLACAAIARGDERPATTSPSLSFSRIAADTIRLQGSWNSVNDAAGNPVVRYDFRLYRDGAVLDSGSVTTTSIIRVLAGPEVGDSAVYQLAVVAVDSRGFMSQPGLSPDLVVRGLPWAPPQAPTVGIDTLAAVLDVDSFTTVVIMEDGTITQTPRFTRVGETAQGCVVEWVDETPRLAAGQLAACNVIAELLGQTQSSLRRS